MFSDDCESSPCRHGSCRSLGATEVVEEYEKPKWTRVSWIRNVLLSGLMKLGNTRKSHRHISPSYGRQKRMVLKTEEAYPNDGSNIAITRQTKINTKDTARNMNNVIFRKERLSKKMSMVKTNRLSAEKTIFIPRCLQKKRPDNLVKYTCECHFGFTGYNCDG